MIWIKLIEAVLVLYLSFLLLGKSIIRSEDSLPEKLVMGFLGVLAIMQLLAIPLIFTYSKFSLLRFLTIFAIILVCAVHHLVRVLSKAKNVNGKGYSERVPYTKKEKILFGIAVLMIVGQLAVVLLFTHTDADDAFYVATAVDSVNTDKMYRIDPHTGDFISSFPVRYVLSPFPMFYSVIGSLFKLSPTIVAHLIVPILAIPLCYTVSYLLGMAFFQEKREKALFMTMIVSVLMLFQGATGYETGSFLLLRSWQGKSILATVIIPYVIYLYIRNADQGVQLWIKITIVILASSNVSSMGIMLTPIVVMIMGIVSSLTTRRWRPIVGSALSCIPSGIYALMYIALYAWKLF